jgi:UDP:flavonoid glycosyltransferase YjiC (YdhE family)
MICLLPNCSFLSETSRMIEIQHALRRRGVPLRVATHGGTHELALTEAGIEYDLVGPRVGPQRSADFVRSVPGIGPRDQSMWTDDELRTYARAEAAYFREHGVRVAVTGWTLTALLSTRLAGIPVVTEHAGAFIPPLFERGLLPEPSRPVGLPLERWLPARVRRALFNAGVERLDSYTEGFNRVAAELGVEGVPSFPALLLGDLSLVTEVPEVLGVSRAEIDGWRPRNPRRYREGTRLRATGPLYAHLDVKLPERVDRLLDERAPVIYVAITSSPPQLIRDVVAALRPLDATILVAATIHDLDSLADDKVHIGGILPSHEIMPRVALAVTAGGQGSVQTALASGTPLVAIPLQPEQDTNAVLAERVGAARRVPLAQAGSPTLTSAAATLLADPGARAAAQRIRDLYAKTDGADLAADAICSLI